MLALKGIFERSLKITSENQNNFGGKKNSLIKFLGCGRRRGVSEEVVTGAGEHRGGEGGWRERPRGPCKTSKCLGPMIDSPLSRSII